MFVRKFFGLSVASAALLGAAAQAQGTQAHGEDDVRIEDTVVVTGQQTPYMRLSETATKTGQDLMDTPLSVTMLNASFLEDLRTESLADAYPYTLGLSQSGTNANSFTLRGLSSSLQNVQIDGLPGLASRFGSPSTANIERVEVLKGPASVLYGLMEPGGLINIVSKRPEAEQATTIGMTAQSHAGDASDFGADTGGTFTLDTTGPLTADGKLLYRVIASAEHIDSFRDGVAYDNLYLFPSLSYQVTPQILATVGLEYVKEESDADDGLVAVNNDVNLMAPVTTRYQEDGDFDTDDGLVAFARLDYDLSENTRIRLNARSVLHEDERKLFENNRVNDAADPLDATLRRRDRHQLNKREYHFIDANIGHEFETGSVRHNVLFGVNGGYEKSDYERIRFGSVVSPNISVFDPVYGGAPNAITAGTDRITEYMNYGAYIQDVVDVTDWFSVMVGGRYDKQEVDFIEQVSDFTDSQSTDAFLPQAGVVIRPNEILSIYASYTESFNPNSVERRAADNSAFDPEMGEQVEVGLKTTLFDERLNLTLAHFDIEKSNIVERNIDGDFELLGELESSGFEFEMQALPLDNWQVRLGYANVDSIVSASPTAALVGARNAFAPEHDAFFWTRYNIDRPVFGGVVGASLGLNYESERYTNASAATQVELPAYTRTDVGLYYDVGRYSLAMNIENLFDETYYTGGTNDTRIYPGDPRLVTLSLKVDL